MDRKKQAGHIAVEKKEKRREKRKRIREEAIKAAESESPAEDVTDGNGKEENKTE